MSDKTEFSLDVDVDSATGFEPLPDLVAYDLCKAYPVPGGSVLLRNTRTGKRAMVRPEVHAVLVSCNRLRTLDQHVSRIIARNPDMQGQQADIREVLQTMLDAGMMISARQTCDELKQPARQSPRSEDKPVVVIITWERPAALERLLSSIYTNCDIGKFHQLYIVDDSRKAENIDKNRELTASFALQAKRPFQYFGQAEQQALLENLSRQLPEHEEAIRFLADQSHWRDHWTSGLARNLALLLSCGHRLVMIDDDTICEVYDPIQPRSDISFSDEARQADFFSEQQEWSSRRMPLNPDPVDRHMQCLGMPFSEALDKLGQTNLKPTGLADANAPLLAQLASDSPVLITECGSFGCPGTNRNTWLPDMAPASLERMLASETKTNDALHTRLVWSGRNQPHFSPVTNMSQITGLDNRAMLPPYFPVFRGEDRLFGLLLKFIFPTAVALDYPWAIPHLPIPQRDWQEKDRDFTPQASFPFFVSAKVQQSGASCQAAEPHERLHALTAFFSDLSNSSNDALAENQRDAVLRDLSEQLQHLSGLLAGADSAPDQWKEYLGNGIKQLNEGLDRASHKDHRIKGQPKTLEGAELIDFWKKAWGGYAAALAAWPEIREVAAEIIEV